MDLIFKRYSSPFLLLDSVIENSDLLEFLVTLYNEVNDEKSWEFYINNVSNMENNPSFDEFLEMNKREAKKKNMKIIANEIDQEKINKANNILNNIKPQ